MAGDSRKERVGSKGAPSTVCERRRKKGGEKGKTKVSVLWRNVGTLFYFFTLAAQPKCQSPFDLCCVALPALPAFPVG